MKILFLENHPSLLDALLQEYRGRGYHCNGTDRSEKALEFLARENYDIIVIDPSEDDRAVDSICLSDILQREYPKIVRVGFTGESKLLGDELAKKRYDKIVLKTIGYEKELDNIFKKVKP